MAGVVGVGAGGHNPSMRGSEAMKKLKNEELEYICRLLVPDKLSTPIPENQVAQKSIRHTLAIWVSKQWLL